MKVKFVVNKNDEAKDATEKVAEKPSQTKSIKFKLDIRSTMDDRLIISDHPEVDIVISTKDNKITLFPKDKTTDMVYDTQNDFFKFMKKKGIVEPSSVRGGNVFGAIEGVIVPNKSDEMLALVVMNIAKFIEKEQPFFEYLKKYEEMEEKMFLDPDDADSTELGEVPQKATKGGIRPGYGGVSSYFLSYML
jgi:hypothetical protein